MLSTGTVGTLFRPFLTHAHACVRVSTFTVKIDNQSLFYQSFQLGEGSVGLDSHSRSLLQQLCTGKLDTQCLKECVTVGIGPMADF